MVTGEVTSENFVTGGFTITAITGDTVTAVNTGPNVLKGHLGDSLDKIRGNLMGHL